MKTMSILINKTSLEISCLSQTSLEYIYDYIDYLLYPYRKLGFFKYNTYASHHTSIDGENSPQLLIDSLKKHTITIKKNVFMPPFTGNTIFLNTESSNFYLHTSEYCKIIQTPKNYFLFFTQIYV